MLADQEFVLTLKRLEILGIVVEERAHNGRSLARGLREKCVEMRQTAIAQFHRRAISALVWFAKNPGFLG